MSRLTTGGDRIAEGAGNVDGVGGVLVSRKAHDHDFNGTVATEPNSETLPARGGLINVEVSGLLPATTSRGALAQVRDAFKEILPDQARSCVSIQPGRARRSLFHAVDHPVGNVGSDKLKPATSWEIRRVAALEALGWR